MSGQRHSSTLTGYKRNGTPGQRPTRHDRGNRVRNGQRDDFDGDLAITRNRYKNISVEVISIVKSVNMTPFSREKQAACMNLIDKCRYTEKLPTYPSCQGFDICQHIVGKKVLELLEYLFQRGFDVGLNSRKCSSLLNIACSGSSDRQRDIVEFLLNHGAMVHHKATLCYPHIRHQHFPPVTSYNKNEFEHSDCCGSSFMTSLQIAVQNDNLPLVKHLLNHEKTVLPLLENGILRYACEKNAVNCLPVLIKTFPNDINSQDETGRNLLQRSFTQSEECGMLFLTEAMKYGLNKEVVNSRSAIINNGTLFHCILWQEHGIRFLDVLNKLFEAGYEKANLQAVDSLGHTTLHLLVLQIGKKIKPRIVQKEMSKLPKTTKNDYESVLSHLEELKREHILAVMKMLLNCGVSKNALSYNGEGILHKLLHNCAYLNYRSLGYTFDNFVKVFPQIISMLELLLRHGFELNISAEYCSTPMNYIINTVSNLSASEVDTIWQNVWYVVNLFLKYGSDPNVCDTHGVNSTCSLLTTLHRWLNSTLNRQGDELIDKDLPIRMVMRIQDLIELFLQNGLIMDRNLMELCCKQISILTNVNKPNAELMLTLRDLFKPFFLYGVDPNRMAMIEESSDSEVPCPLHAQFYLARSFIIHIDTKVMFQFISIFTNTLHQKNLNALLLCLGIILKENFNNSDADASLICIRELDHLRQTVRPLKVLARIRVAEALNWEIGNKKILLPFPKILQDYISQI